MLTAHEKQKIKSTLALIARSPDRGEGWRNVSEPIWPLVKDMPSDLFDLDVEQRRIRMTDQGRAVLTYA